ncbi:Vesicular-fusion protein sec18 [Cucumispora dikerogammari]|nr:Vesicular-fusion protein sec18 [Cucumispora dikerogammari]
MSIYQTTRTKLPSQAYSNKLHITKSLFKNFKTKYVLADTYLYKIEQADESEEYILLSKIQREFLNKSVNDIIEIKKIENHGSIPILENITVSIEILVDLNLEIDNEEFKKSFLENFNDTPFNKNQLFYFRYNDFTLKCKIVSLKDAASGGKASHNFGLLEKECNLVFVSDSPKVTILNKELSTLDLESLGIGGLSNEFSLMFRRAFLQRTLSTTMNEKLGTDFIKGMMLYGPPGTGKTLIARKISQLLNCRKPKVVCGPEILDKYVGESEKNIRELFAEAEAEYKSKGEKSSLHIIIFDEIDAICKQRSSTNGTHSDNIVNQILTKMDGIDKINNILVIGMTNRIDLIDAALMRPGRFELKIEIGLPDCKGRADIFKIHTKNLKENDLLTKINLTELSKKTVNYTGAEIAAVVKSAISFSLERNTPKSKNETKSTGIIKVNENDLKVTEEDFYKAISEIKPIFGNSDLLKPHIFYEFKALKHLINEAVLQMSNLKNTNLYSTGSLLIYGEKGVGKTTFAMKIAEMSDIPFIRIIKPVKLIGMSEFDRVNFIKSIFYDAYKSSLSLIILDNLESLVDYVSIGPRFSNQILQALKLFIVNENIQKNKIFVVATCTNEEIINELGLYECFDKQIEVPLINEEGFKELCSQNSELNNLEFFGEESIKKILNRLSSPDGEVK